MMERTIRTTQKPKTSLISIRKNAVLLMENGCLTIQLSLSIQTGAARISIDRSLVPKTEGRIPPTATGNGSWTTVCCQG